ncbi:MAG: alpha amylase C-terminal domain-containing protein, partial [Clostridia bacterium]|nr:alpha amylase C-terminal domain-containing protein [Clostridia bacterium]
EQELDWKLLEYPLHAALQTYVAELNRLYLKHGAFSTPLPAEQGFQWIAADDTDHSVISFRLNDGKEEIVCVFNFSGAHWQNYRIGVPYRGNYKPILTSNDPAFGGWGGEEVVLTADRSVPLHGHKQSIVLDLPPLSAKFYVHKIYKNKKNS